MVELIIGLLSVLFTMFCDVVVFLLFALTVSLLRFGIIVLIKFAKGEKYIDIDDF